MEDFNKRLNYNVGCFDYIDLDIGKNNNNYYLSIIIFGLGFDYGTNEGGFRLINQWRA